MAYTSSFWDAMRHYGDLFFVWLFVVCIFSYILFLCRCIAFKIFVNIAINFHFKKKYKFFTIVKYSTNVKEFVPTWKIHKVGFTPTRLREFIWAHRYMRCCAYFIVFQSNRIIFRGKHYLLLFVV